MKTLLVIDAHAIIHRAYHAIPPLTTGRGIQVNALYGFFGILEKTVAKLRPTHVAICFDTPVKTFRKELLTTYQHKRPPLEEGLKLQIPLIKEAIDKAGIARLEKEGFEADDVIGTVVKKAAEQQFLSYILTGDKDIFQLVSKHVCVIMPKNGSDITLFTPQEVEEKMGVPPQQITDYKALVGDSSDNYGGVKGIGPKTAISLLRQFHSIEEMYNHVDDIKNPRIRELLTLNKESAFLTKTIATIVCDVPVEFNLERLAFNGFKAQLKTYLEELEMVTLVDRLFRNAAHTKKGEEKAKAKEPDPADEQITLF